MFVLVKDQLPIKELDESAVILQISEDQKSFKVLRHASSEICYQTYHISMLKHFVLGAEKNEETN